MQKTLIITISLLSFLFCSNNKPLFSSYNKLIESYPQFLDTNYFEDEDYYYYIITYSYNDKSNYKRSKKIQMKNNKKKARLKALSDLSGSVCCGFDIGNMRTLIRKINVVDKDNNKLTKSFEIKQHTTDVSSLDNLITLDTGTSIIYGVRANKHNISIDGCECNLVIN